MHALLRFTFVFFFFFSFSASGFGRLSARWIFDEQWLIIQWHLWDNQKHTLNSKGTYSRIRHILPQYPSFLLMLSWVVYSQAVYFSFFVICPVSLLLGTQIEVNRQGWEHLATHPKPQHDSAWLSMTQHGCVGGGGRPLSLRLSRPRR